MRLVYADPPYLGKSREKYGGEEVDFSALIATISGGNYDGWALSCNSTDLHTLLPMCPAGTRVGSWIKTWAAVKKGNYPTYVWEPVLFRPARKLPCSALSRDALVCFPGMGRKVNGKNFVGWKPPAFSYWLFGDLLAAKSGDELEDLFPGTGAVTEAWRTWQHQIQLWAS